MSQIASFYVVPRDAVQGLGGQPDLAAVGRELPPPEWSGYAFVMALTYLDESGISLMDSDFDDAAGYLSEALGATAFVFTPAHKSHLGALDPGRYDEAGLRRWSAEFNENDDPDAGRAMLNAIDALRGHIGGLDDGSALVLIVG